MGAELALKEYNDKGGYQSKKVEAVIYDDETKPAKGVENVTRLITRDKVFAIVGPVNSGVALAIIDIAQKNQVPLMDTIATAEQIIERYKNAPKNYIFRVSLNDGIQTSFNDRLHQGSSVSAGRPHARFDRLGPERPRYRAAPAQGGQSRPRGRPEVFDQNDTDMTTQLTKMQDAKAEFIIVYSLAPAGVQIAKSMQKIGLKTPWTGTWG